MDIEDELRGYAVDHEPDGWPAIRMDKLMQAANEIGRLRDELSPTWNDVGEAATLAAAAEDADERLALLRGCLDQLAPQARRSIDYRYQNEHLPPQIAELTGCTVQSVNVTLSRARAFLRDCVQRKMAATPS